MSWIIKDWTKDIVPRVRDNPGINGKLDKSMRTTDSIWIKSWDEIKKLPNELREKSATDFAIMMGCYVSFYKAKILPTDSKPLENMLRSVKMLPTSRYWLHSSECTGYSHTTRSMSYQCDDKSELKNTIERYGLCPSLSLRLPPKTNLKNISERVGDVKQALNFHTLKLLYHTIELGEYPKTKVSEELREKLELLFNNGDLQGDLKCTGKLFDGNTEFNHFCPEFELDGQRYVRVRVNVNHNHIETIKEYHDGSSVEDRVEWVKVEPITFRILNFNELKKGKAKTLELESDEIIIGGIVYSFFDYNSGLWQNSFCRTFLNSANYDKMDGNPAMRGILSRSLDNYENRGFLYQALNMTRAPERELILRSRNIPLISGCIGIEKIIIPPDTYLNCWHRFDSTVQIVYQTSEKMRYGSGLIAYTSPISCFSGSHPLERYFYIAKDGSCIISSPFQDKSLENKYVEIHLFRDYVDMEAIKFITSEIDKKIGAFIDLNYRKNFVSLYDNKKIGYTPRDYILKTFPSTEFKNYFLHNNDQRWGRLVRTLCFDHLNGYEKENSLTDLMKIYYAIGGFSENQGECEKAYNYILDYVAKTNNPNATTSDIGAEIHSRFSGLNLDGPYSPEFAKFFMRYYKDNPDFMKTCLHEGMNEVDYLCQAHNAFKRILSLNPNRTVNGNTRNSLLSPEFILKNLFEVKYTNIKEGNEKLAEIMGSYAYEQSYFDKAQEIFNKAKADKGKAFLCAERASHKNGLSFRLLEKDDPLGFVIGNITTCCQRLDDLNARTCVIDGYLNPKAGFMVFEQDQFDINGKVIGKRIVGQAYVWYDPKTKTVCYDNIEVPITLVDKLFSGDKKQGETFTSENFIDTVIESADAIMRAMNVGGNIVERVTTGEQYNDLKDALNKKFGRPETKNLAVHRGYSGYSDAKEKQFLIRTYDQTTKDYANKINQLSDEIGKDLNVIEANAKSDSIDKRWG